ncbi:hypothetical protein CRM22_005066 [Opisthorchis felineus]|uniref:C2H2-type domain-containing protein n=1 Tax=Opisthorchis felineus TaxID=147828 RepID=A0A4S2LZJ8_OPIFE|nr:hypothetical protein CRM22_005066 [Opisthorchis felineus]
MSDGLSITRVHFTDPRTHHLVTNIKQEPRTDSPEPTYPHAPNEPRESSQTVIPAFSTPTSHAMPTASHALQGLQERPLRPKSHVPHPSIPGQASTQASCISASAAIHAGGFQFSTSSAVSRPNPTTSSVPVPLAPLLHPSVRPTVPTLSQLTPILISAGMAPSHIAEQHHDLRARGLVPTLVNSSGLSAPTNLYGLQTANHAYLTHPSAPRHPFSQMHSSMPRISVFNSLSTPTCIPAPLHTTSNNQPSNTVTAASFQSKPRTIRPNRPDLPPMAMNCGRLVPSRFPNPPKSLNAPMLGSHQQPQIASGQPTPTLDVTSPGLGVGETRPCLFNTSPEQLHPSLHTTTTTTPTTTTTTTAATAHTVTRIISPVCSTSISTAHTGPSLVNSGSSVQSASGTVTTTASPAPGSVSFSGTNADSDSTDSSALVPVAWGRVVRMADGALHFPGIGRQLFSNPQSVLQRIRAAASPDDSFSLQLPPNSIDFDIPMEARTNNLMKHTSTDCGSRKGFHVCLCCQQTFTSPSLYDSHMLRPLARIFYRCHICRGSETAHLTSVEENPGGDLHMSIVDLLNASGSDAPSGPSTAVSGGCIGPVTNTSAGTMQQQLPSHSPYCTVLFGGIVKAFNRCAVYSHFAHAHPNEVDLWNLQPSRISVCPLAESAWEPSTLELNGTDIVLATCVSGVNSTTHDSPSLLQISEPDTGRQPSSSPISHPTGVSEPAPPVINDNLSEDGNRAAKKLEASFPYRPGVELAEVWNDLEQAINEAILHHGLNFLSPPDGYIDFTGASSTLMASSSLAFDSRHSTVTNSPALQRIYASTADSSFSAASASGPVLPSPNSTLSETILHLARAPVWYSHFFLTDWSQVHSPVPNMATVSSEPESSQPDQPIIDEDHHHQQQPQPPRENGDERDKLAEKKPKSRSIVPPPAPSNNELNDVLLNFVQHVRPSTAQMCALSDPTPTLRPSETSIPVSTSEPSSFQSPCSKSAPTPPPEDTERGFLRCLLCSYKTNHPDYLVRHLSGSRNTVSTKCALCGQSVCVQQPALCAAKAHLLLHLGYYIMCPNCGFTPTPHLAPDAAELCMRLHLRFVCFHFNLLQVFVCSRCQHGRGKAYNTMAHLCQHIFDSHTQRQHVCLWCARQSSNDPTTRSASTVALRNTPAAESGSAASSTKSSDPIEHDGIHNQPSQNIADSSSVPLSRFGSRYTTPKDLLAHVKRVHKHVLLFSSSDNVVATNGQDAIDQPPGDLTHGKQSQHRQSQSILSIDSLELTKSTNGELPITNGPTSVCAKSRGAPPDSTESDKATGHLIHLVPAVDFTYVHSCPDCDEVFENRDTFTQHFRASHFSNCSGVCCYRCFGSCKRLSFDLAEFHEHLVTCPSARDLFVATFAHGRLGTVRSANPDHRSPTGDCASVRGHSHPLCFCLHCGIGARRPGPQPRFSGEDDCSTPKSSMVPGDERSNSEQTPGTPQATDVATADTQPTTVKELVYDARYFPDLHSLHHHESQFHFTPTSSQIACPWCGRRLSCHSTADMRFTMHHLRSHMKKHPFAAWSLERTRKWNRNAKALSHCICGAALLDSPLAVLSHASSHLLLSRPSKLSTTSSRLFLTDAWTPHLRLPSTTDVIGLSPVNDRPLTGFVSASSSFRRLHRPSPGAHIPCMVDVYHHLRFAVAPELDHYLDHASLVSDPFVCPLCSSSVSTRWALSEHAFVEHWGLLCFICCLLPLSDTERGPDKRPTSLTTDHHQPSKETSGAASHETTDQTNTSSSPTDTMLVCLAPTASVRPPQSALSTVSEKASSSETVSIWEHIYRCMRERSESLQSKQSESTGQSTTTGLRQPGTTVKVDEGGCGAAFKRYADGNIHELDPADPILVDSSPEVSPRSERTSVTADESDYTVGSQRSKRSRRLIIVDNDDQEQQADRSSVRDAADSPKNDSVFNRTEELNGKVVSQPPRTFSLRYSELGTSASKDESGSFLCIICGEQQTLDTWEDHSLSHRNPQMPWNGIQLSDPRRLVLMHRQTKIYKCYICDRRFVTRFGCQRHMTGRHKMAKSRISWDLLTQSPSTAHGNRSPDRQCNTVARKSSLTSTHRCNNQPLPAPPPYPRASEYAPTLCMPPAVSVGQTVDNTSQCADSQQPLRSSVAVGHCSAESTAPPSSEPQQQQLHYCNVCRIPFMSQLSFSIHLAAAHNSSVT